MKSERQKKRRKRKTKNAGRIMNCALWLLLGLGLVLGANHGVEVTGLDESRRR